MKKHIILILIILAVVQVMGLPDISIKANTAAPQKTINRFSLAARFMFSLFPERSRVFLLSESPLKLVYLQLFEKASANAPKIMEGRLLMTFAGNALTLEGIHLKEIAPGRLGKEWDTLQLFQPIIVYRDQSAADLFPIRREIAVSGMVDKRLSVAVGSNRLTVLVSFNIVGDKTHVSVYHCSTESRSQQEILVCEFDYEGMYQGAPWVSAWDLDGDSVDEIVIGQVSYKHASLYILSLSPGHFRSLKEISRTIQNFGDWPSEEAEIFLEGKLTRIMLRGDDESTPNAASQLRVTH